ncbi:MAG: hypothetical protein SFX18_03395 [Pirellulales bacterium]|nr:hypothetical protein [Pirellulales bacterium]
MKPPATPSAPERRSFPWMNLFLGLFALLIVIGTVIAIWPIDNSLTVSPQTTVITAPLAADGLPDYVAYFNQENSRGVLPSENVYIDILEAVGMENFNSADVPQVLQMLQMRAAPQGPFLKRMDDWYFEKLPRKYHPPILPFEKCFDELTGKWVSLLSLEAPPENDFDVEQPPLPPSYALSYKFLESVGLYRPIYGPPQPLSFESIKARQESQIDEMIFDDLNGTWQATHPYTVSLLQLNKPILDRLAAALENKHKYYVPLFIRKNANPNNSPINGSISDLHAARILILNYNVRLINSLENGDISGALTDFRTMLRIAGLRQNRDFLSDELSMNALVGMTIEHARAFILHPRVERAHVRQLFDDALLYMPTQNFAKAYDQGERLLGIAWVVHYVRQAQAQGTAQGLELGYFENNKNPHHDFNWDRVAEILNQHFDSIVKALQQPKNQTFQATQDANYQRAKLLTQDIEKNFKQPWAFFVGRESRSDILGHHLSLLFAYGLGNGSAANINNRAQAMRRSCLLLLALDLYRRNNGQYPPQLSDLAPKYLQQVPLDPYNDKDFIYRKVGNGYLCYSVGPDLQDDGGVENWQAVETAGQLKDYAIGTPDQVPVRFWFSW